MGPWVKTSIAGTSILFATFATGCASHAAGESGSGAASSYDPSSSTDRASGALGVSVGEGPPGTVIDLHAVRCLPRGSKPDEIVWQDSSFSFKPGHQTKGGLELTHIVRTGNELDATFTIPAGTPPGVGFFVTYCGAKALAAEAGFTVDGR